MVNLEEIMEKKPYTCPVMVVEKIDFSDILTTSGKPETVDEEGGEYGDDVLAGGYNTIGG